VKRQLMQFLCAIGVLLGVVAGVAVVRGFGVTDVWRVTIGQNPAADAWFEHRALLATSHSICAIIYGHTRCDVTNQSIRVPIDRFNARHDTGRARPFTEPAQRHGPWWQRVGFQLVWWTAPLEPMAWGTMHRSERGLILPTWFVALLAALMTIVPARYLRKQRRLRQRRAAGQCLACGYDLRGAEHARCPECGAGAPIAAV
jgi:hypothetical protein